MKIEQIFRHFMYAPVSFLPITDETGEKCGGFISKEKIQMEMADLSLAGREYELIPEHLITTELPEDIIKYFQKNTMIPVIGQDGERKSSWDKPRFLAEIARLNQTSSVEESTPTNKQNEEESREKIQRFMKLILESLPECLYATDVEGNTIFYNEKFEQEILNKPTFRSSLSFSERFLRDMNRDLFASYLRSHDLDEGKSKPPVLQSYLQNIDSIVRVIPLETSGKTLGFLYQFLKSKSSFSSMNGDGLDFPSPEEYFYNQVPLEKMLEETEAAYISHTLQKHKNNISHSAQALQIPRSTLQNRLRHLGLEEKLSIQKEGPIPRFRKPKQQPKKQKSMKPSQKPEKKKPSSKTAKPKKKPEKLLKKKLTGKKVKK